MYSDQGLFNRRLTKNYFLARIICQSALRAKLQDKKLLLIYQMGKVGSTSVVKSLQDLNLNMPILQVHALSERGINEMEKRYYGDRFDIFQKSYLPETTHLFMSYYLRSTRRSRKDEVEWKIITLVRDPLARNISEFFYSVDTTKSNPYLPDFYERYAANKISTSDIIQRFLQIFNDQSEDFRFPLLWFDQEFVDATGIDVYKYPFPKEKGYMRIHSNGLDVLCLKLERLQECSSEAIQEFLDLPNFQLEKANVAKQKRYFPAYRDFIQSVSFPEEYLDKVYNSKYVQHFYSEEEIKSFWNKWG